MKHLTSVILFILLSGQMVWGQEDEKAAGILERMAKKYQQIEAFSADFSQSMINEQEGINESFTGKGIIKKNKYKIEVAGRTLYNNGREIWTYSPDDEEVTISPVSDEEEIDPTFIFSNYKKDFKFRYLGETRLRGKMLQKVALFPRKPEGKSFFKI
ncbi:MAG: outer membrane lipoprotein carrier protein LolA [Cytophagales bacterium]|nr:outer membrane lipoprotein carrier protein LolA [Cytophagales bacterium]